MSGEKDGMPCAPCRAGRCSDCVPWGRGASLTWSYCTCPNCAFDEEGPEAWEPSDEELASMHEKFRGPF